MIERELIQGCRRGDRKAQQEVYLRTAERVYRLVLRIAGNPDDAFDIAQDTYIRAFQRIDQFDERATFYTWLCRIAVNEALQFRRRGAARAHRESAAAALTTTPDPDPPDARLDVESALAALPAADRALLILRYQEGLDYQTIAEIAGCEPGTVGSRLARARERVRRVLKNGYGCEEENALPEHPIHRGTGESARPDAFASRQDIRLGGGS